MTSIVDRLVVLEKYQDGDFGLESAISTGATLAAALTLKYYQDYPNTGEAVDVISWDPLWKKIRWCDRHPYGDHFIKAIKQCVAFNNENKDLSDEDRFERMQSIALKAIFSDI